MRSMKFIQSTLLLAIAFVSHYTFATNNYNTTDASGAVSGVSSFNTRTGAVTPTSGDYSSFYLGISNNLSDLGNAGTAKTNLHDTVTCAVSTWVNLMPGTTSNPTCTQPAFTDISGSVAATQLPNPSSTTLGGVKSLASVSHQWINSISTAGAPTQTQPTTSDVLASATNDSGPAGYVGEVISCTVAVGSELSVTTATTLNICSVSLTAGDWRCSGTADVDANAATVVTYTTQGISSVSATLSTNQDWYTTFNKGGVFPVTGSLPFGPVRVSLASTTTHYFTFRSTFTTNVMSVYGTMLCTRVR